MKTLKILFCGILCASVSNVRADWITFQTPSTLSAIEQKILKTTFTQSLVQKFFYLPTALATLSKTNKFDLSSGTSIMSCLFCKDRKQADHDELASLMNLNVVQSSFKKTASVKKVCLQSATDSQDGIVNSVVRDTLQPYMSTFTAEQFEEAFEALWVSVSTTFDLSAITDDVLEPFLEEYPDIKTHLQGIASASGDNLCEKLANYLAQSCCDYIESLVEKSGCCLGCKACLQLSKDYIMPIVQDVASIVQMLAAI